MIRCEECQHDPVPDCHLCEEITFLHSFRMEAERCKCTPIEACDDCHSKGLHYGEEE